MPTFGVPNYSRNVEWVTVLYLQMARSPLNRNVDHGDADISDVRRPPRQRVDVAVETGQ